jgi:cytidylate kinase
MYRAVTLAAMQANADLQDQARLLQVLIETEFEFEPQPGRMRVKINGMDVTEKIRASDVTANARYIAQAPKVREKLVQMQRRFAAGHEKVVTEGRDQGTVAFADADVKFFLTADISERARRRMAELDNKDYNLQQLKKDMEERDASDRQRANGPLKPAPDAIIIDTTNISIEEVVEKLLICVREKCSQDA